MAGDQLGPLQTSHRNNDWTFDSAPRLRYPGMHTQAPSILFVVEELGIIVDS
jgi:hypothetical protein